ncbi:H/ACA ribonucleoprotein complex subunit 2-like protein [Neocloeon triangulifer]|uniref:H/ACA ribonucleoprotein complex subunit 2-like protein n=1 Tax=Neocloeon triangulifer TaxID=2078957 RepID=UPI00286F8F4B|nr:H/ACA ribonucleoprotein complex subunit 2-like protein [Neocloeon triangulifer]
MGKKKSVDAGNGDVSMAEEEVPYADKLKFVNKIAKPMAGKKLNKKLLKLAKKASKDKKNNMVFGLKAVQRALRKGEKGIVILAGDVNPIDIMSHIPGVCEQLALPYVYIPSRQDLGQSIGTLRSILLMLIKPRPDYQELYSECQDSITTMPEPVWRDDHLQTVLVKHEIKSEPEF